MALGTISFVLCIELTFLPTVILSPSSDIPLSEKILFIDTARMLTWNAP